jgi:hypothetical protein
MKKVYYCVGLSNFDIADMLTQQFYKRIVFLESHSIENLLTNSTQNRVLAKLIVILVVNKFPTIHGNRGIITGSRKPVVDFNLSPLNAVHMALRHISVRSVLIVFHTCLCLKICIFSSNIVNLYHKISLSFKTVIKKYSCLRLELG